MIARQQQAIRQLSTPVLQLAQTLVSAGVDLTAVTSAGDLQSGIELARGLLR